MKEQVSVWMDGELDEEDARIVFARLRQDPALCQEWDAYHLIGDCLRQTPHFSEDFSVRVLAQLANEPTVLAPHRPLAGGASRAWSAWSLAASLAAVSLVTGTVFWINRSDAPVASPAPSVAVADTSEVNRYLIAHKEYSSVDVPGGIPFVRTALDERGGRGQ